MAEIIRMPLMSDTMEEGNIVGWFKKEGDTVQVGETLAEVETDKATMELDSPADGTLLHIAAKEGVIKVGGIIAIIGQKEEDWKAVLAAQGASSSVPVAVPGASSVEQEPQQAPVLQSIESATADSARVKASPLAKSIAKEAGVDLNKVSGSGEGGRIVKRDVEALVSSGTGKATEDIVAAPKMQPMTVSGSLTPFEDKPVSQMRKAIARRLGESKFSAPHFYLTMEVNMDAAKQARERINEISPIRISYNDLVIKATAVALKQHPAVNASWMGDKIRYNHDVHIGVAVAVEEGLLVPVVRHADGKTLSYINTEVKELAARAKVKKLQPEEMQGNTFSISNLGMFDIDEFTAIINPPDSCILAVGSIIEKPIVKNGQIVVGNMMKITLSCDHRVVDGATGAKFLQTLKGLLEDPIRMLV